MPRLIRPLEQNEVDKLCDPGLHSVGGVPGLAVQVKSGNRSWILRTTIKGKRRDIGLGPCASIAVDAARALAKDFLAQQKLGISRPIGGRQSARVSSDAPWVHMSAKEPESAAAAIAHRIMELANPGIRAAIDAAVASVVAELEGVACN